MPIGKRLAPDLSVEGIIPQYGLTPLGEYANPHGTSRQ